MDVRIDALERLAQTMVGDGKGPDVFFVTLNGNVVSVTTDLAIAHYQWSNLPCGADSSLENRRDGVICQRYRDEDSGIWIVTDDTRSMRNNQGWTVEEILRREG